MSKLIKAIACVAFAAICGNLFAYNGGYENSSLTDITIGGVTYKGYGNNTLTARNETGTSIGPNRYAQCKKLTSVNLTGVTAIGNAAFAYSALTSVELPSTLTTIGYIPFGGCASLSSVTINGTAFMTSGSETKEPFRDCANLKTVTAKCAPPSWDFKKVFPNVTTVKVPQANLSAWQAKKYSGVTVSVQSADACIVRLHSNTGADTVVEQEFKKGVAQSVIWISTLGWTKTGYTFAGWGTKASATTTSYINGQKVTFTDPSKVTDLYAIWKATPNTYKITLHRNISATDSSSTGQIVSKGETISLCWIGQIGWTRDGYTFAGWGTKANATAVSYINGQKVKDLVSPGDVKHLYAIWKPRATAYTITLHRNLNASDTSVTGQIATKGESLSLAWITQIGWTRDNYVFAGWGTKADATAISYINGQKVTDLAAPGGVKHLYAVWKLRTSSYTVTFNKNDGSGAKTGKIFGVGETAALVWITQVGWTNPGYTFAGWSKAAGSKIIAYTNGAQVMNLASAGGTVNLYAVWQKKASAFSAMPANAPAKSGVQEDAGEFAAGYFSGLLSLPDGVGYYEMIVNEDGRTGFVRIVFADGEVLSADVLVVVMESCFLVQTEDGETYALRR